MVRKSFAASAVLALALVVSFAAGAAQEEGSWTGEIVEKACFVDRGAHGPDHASCAKRCFDRGGEMGLLTDDGTLVLLVAGEDDAPFEALKDHAGQKVEVSGSLAERDGMKVVTVSDGKPAS